MTNNKEKENAWYLNIATTIYMTHNLKFDIILDINHQIVEIEIADGTILKMQSASIIDFNVLVKNEHIQIELRDVYYLSKWNVDLISFEVLKENRYEFYTINNFE